MKKNGHIFAIRDEFRKYDNKPHFGNKYMYLCLYQWNNRKTRYLDWDKTFGTSVDEKWLLNGYYAENKEKITEISSFLNDYFFHFDKDELKNNPLQRIFEQQGRNGIYFTSSFTCFESILAIFEYIELLNTEGKFDKIKQFRRTHGRDPSIRIIGAGPAGLLTFHFLKTQLGINQRGITLFEKDQRVGGKSLSKKITYNCKVSYAELGTCYLHPGYRKLVERLNIKGLFAIGGPPGTRGIYHNGKVIDYLVYLTTAFGNITPAEIMRLLINYQDIHVRIMTRRRPFPKNVPRDLYQNGKIMAFSEFLIKYKLGALTGIFEYSYQVQGYGLLGDTSAYYGMIWLTPEATNAFTYKVFEEKFKSFEATLEKDLDMSQRKLFLGQMQKLFGPKERRTVDGIRNGWQSVWENMVSEEGIKIIIKKV